MSNVNIDLRRVKAPYIRIADQYKILSGYKPAIITKFELRFVQPNEESMYSSSLHSLEHLLSENIRNHSASVLDIFPMGCRTGFYLLMDGDWSCEEILILMKKTLIDVRLAESVPECSQKECGNHQDHNLEGARYYAGRFLFADDLLKVFKEE